MNEKHLLIKQAVKNAQLDIMEAADNYYRQKRRVSTRDYIDYCDNVMSQLTLKISHIKDCGVSNK